MEKDITLIMEKVELSIKDLVKDNLVTFYKYKTGFFYYHLKIDLTVNDNVENSGIYEFTIPIDDIGDATMQFADKAITYMRWIRKAKEKGTLIKVD